MAVPVDHGPLAEHLRVGLELLAEVPPELDLVPEVGLRLDPADLPSVQDDRVVQQGVRGLRELPPQVLLRAVGEVVLLQPGREPRLPLDPPGPLELSALRGVDPVGVQDLHDLPSQPGVRDRLRASERVPERAARGLARLLDELGHQHRREPPLPGDLEVAPPAVPLLEQARGLLLDHVEPLGGVPGDPVGVDHHEKVRVQAPLLGEPVHVGRLGELSGELLVLFSREHRHGRSPGPAQGVPKGPGLNGTGRSERPPMGPQSLQSRPRVRSESFGIGAGRRLCRFVRTRPSIATTFSSGI